jgi:hypothetical protein
VFSGLTASAILGEASTFGGEIQTVVLLVVGFAVCLILANWVVAKFRGRA